MALIGEGLNTFFAAPERVPSSALKAISLELKNEFLMQWFDALPVSVLVINQFRQIIYCNEAFRQLSLKPDANDVIGLRPGEALNCVHANLEEAGCGCSWYCNTCGAAKAIVKSLEGMGDCQNCRLLRLVDEAETSLDLQVFTNPINFRGQDFVLLCAMDISHELRLNYLTRVFHHGLINAAGGIATVSELIEADPEDNTLLPLMVDSSKRILRDVLYYRDLNAAERNELAVMPEPIESLPYLKALVEGECRIRNTQSSFVDLDVTCATLSTDRRILKHVIRNMLVNALEARVDAAGQILLECHDADDGKVLISMTNNGEIPIDIQKQMFKRYVSTKSQDRGLGTYVMKLFTQKFLNGEIDFESANGLTTFRILLPKNL